MPSWKVVNAASSMLSVWLPDDGIVAIAEDEVDDEVGELMDEKVKNAAAAATTITMMTIAMTLLIADFEKNMRTNLVLYLFKTI